MTKTILWVDDDSNILAGFQRLLRKQFTIDAAGSGAEGLRKMREHGPYAVVVADMQMPEMDGIQFLAAAEKTSPDTVRLMLTGNADQKTAVEAVNQGHVFRFLTKPCSPEKLSSVLQAGLRQYHLITAERELLEETLNGAIRALTGVLATMDPGAFALGEKLQDYMRVYVKHYRISQSWALEMAAMLSQIGFVAIPAQVLLKVRCGLALSAPEKDMLTRVPQTGADLLAKIPRLGPVAEIVLYQQKHFDGTGFPVERVKGEQIPIGARILKVLLDLVDREGNRQSRTSALMEMRSHSGRYDPEVLDSVSACFDVCPQRSEAGPKPREISLRELRPGFITAADIETCDGALLVTAGTMIAPMLLEKLRNFAQLKILKEPLLIQVAP